MKKRIECIVTGRVQMVMYRDFVARTARRLGLVGNAHNENDGSVLVIAEGDEGVLVELIKELHKGSLLARVEQVVVTWTNATEEFTDFHIRY